MLLQKQITLFKNTYELFLKKQSSAGILLIICTIIALILANLHFTATPYQALHGSELGVKVGQYSMMKPLYHWVNDGLMAIFFLLVGLEIKREVISGELSQFNKSLLPVCAAIGGMVVPALIFVFFNLGKASIKGWAIPMATDIAFAIGILTLLKNRIPASLIVLLTAIAIVDDLGAVTVIALFYTDQIAMNYLFYAAITVVALLLLNLLKVDRLTLYLLLGALLWYFLLKSGVHATIAGVLLAFTIPNTRRPISNNAYSKSDKVLQSIKSDLETEGKTSENTKAEIHYLTDLLHASETPLQRLEYLLHKPVMFIIVPIFVLINAGLSFHGLNIMQTITEPMALGIIAGLFLGKIIGIFGVSSLLVILGVTKLPAGVNLKHMLGLSLITGIGFTMSIFIADLAFGDQATLLSTAKLGIMCASLLSGILGYAVLYFSSSKTK